MKKRERTTYGVWDENCPRNKSFEIRVECGKLNCSQSENSDFLIAIISVKKVIILRHEAKSLESVRFVV